MTIVGEAVDKGGAAQFARHLANLHSLRLVKERVVLGRLETLVARAPDAAAKRTLAIIVREATTQRNEVEEVLLAWRRSIQSSAARAERPRDAPLSFREVVASLVRVQRESARMYESAARDCPDPALASRLSRLAAQDLEHALILEELLERA